MKKVVISALAVVIIAFSLPDSVRAGEYESVIWPTGDGGWWYGIRQKSCTGDNCTKPKGKTNSKKDAKKQAKDAAKKANKGVYDDGVRECSEPGTGIRC